MIRVGDTVKLNGASFDVLIRMGIKPDVAEFILKQSTFKVLEVGVAVIKVAVKNRKVEVLKKYIEKAS